MNRVKLLCAMNRRMMESFSQGTVARLKTHTLFRLALPPFQSFLDVNVDKEIAKDRGVICLAADLMQTGSQPSPTHVAELLGTARQIDQDFLRKASVFPIDIKIEYQDIEHYRQQRIELLLQASYRILAQWQGMHSYRAAVKKLYTQVQFQDLIHEVLRLYAMETRMLSRSVHIPHLLNLARDALTLSISQAMTQEATALAESLAHSIYRRYP